MWAEVTIAAVGCVAVVGLAAFANGNYWPPGAATRYAQEHGITEPLGGMDGPFVVLGFPEHRDPER